MREVRVEAAGHRQDESTAAEARRLQAAPASSHVAGQEAHAARQTVRSRVRLRESLYRRLLALADVLAAATALILNADVLGDDRLNLVALAVIPAVIGVSKAVGLYDRDDVLVRKATLDEVPDLARVTVLYALVVWLLDGFFIEGVFGADQFLAFSSLLLGLMVVGRTAARTVAGLIAADERCLVVGRADAAEMIATKFANAPVVRASVVGRVPIRAEAVATGAGSASAVPVPVIGDLRRLSTLLVEYEIDRVVIAPESGDASRLLETVRLVKAAGANASVLPRLLEIVGSSVELDELNGAILLAVPRYGLSRSSRALKRAVDLAGAGAGLIVLAPFLAAVAVAIKIDSRGPILFRQRRMGRDDKTFWMLKFRTMVDNADELKPALAGRNEADGFFKIADDPRITRAGRLLRRASLDELPQLINVVRGEMSLVGPRPLVIEEDRHVEGWQRRRLQVRPGLTGPWQIFGSSRIPLREMVKIDYLYGANWSLWLDIKILLRTVPYVLARRGL